MKYSVVLPTGTRFQALAAALCPPPAGLGGAYQSRGTVAGGPVQSIPAPGAQVDQGLVGKAMQGTSRSSDAPNYRFPSQYWEGDMNEAAPVRWRSTNEIPVPAERPANMIYAEPFQVRVGGNRQIFQPQVVPVWYGLEGTPYA